ncbi:hypothetical protein PE067_11795 [Paracoccus sp. DMF-8]|uniref:hypothetical protein n=1 Tax=Paracoccus sp. DMF-8 TaxID=3019445 RepID=UPI0023E8ED70|nr:hypothetical protein [Paracoccus sp. DMF-8]MDF3606749.1 hypothetical protein [Paracoccus sp. DMF-8]
MPAVSRAGPKPPPAIAVRMLENGAPIRQKQDLSLRSYLARDRRPENAIGP